MRRRNACIVFGVLAWFIGMTSVFSFNIWSDVAPLGMIEVFEGMTPFALVDYFTANLMMPIGAILIAIFVGWRIQPQVLADELSFISPAVRTIWLWLIRVVAPVAILAIMIGSVTE